MKKIRKYLRLFLINTAALWLIIRAFGGVSLSGGYQTLFLTALVLTLINLFVRPLIKLLFLPINLVTLGAFRWVINVLALYLVTLIVPEFKISAFLFPGFSYQGFVVPSFPLSTFWAFILSSFLLSLIASLLVWLVG